MEPGGRAPSGNRGVVSIHVRSEAWIESVLQEWDECMVIVVMVDFSC
ncbi:hypothetical protein [Synechococcus sp. MIT S9503]